MVQVRCQAGATLEATESIDLITEAIDLQRCLMIPFTSDSVAARIQAWHVEANHNRYQYIAQQIQDTLQADETGLSPHQRAPSSPVPHRHRGLLHSPAGPGRIPPLGTELGS